MTAALAILRRFWWAVPITALAALLWIRTDQRDDARQTLANERTAWTAALDQAERTKAATERRYAEQQTAAALSYADRLAARESIILRSTNTVREYAQTDAGRTGCLATAVVREFTATRRALFTDNPATSSSGSDGVRADQPANPAERLDDQR